jgi:hypothetical protein
MGRKTPEVVKRSVSFPLDVVDDWPPVAVECLPFDVVANGLRLTAPPLFVKQLSVGDVIKVRERSGRVTSWKHASRSGQSTLWLLSLKRGGTADIKRILASLHRLGCTTSSVAQLGSHAISVPADLPIEKVDALLARLKPERVAVAFPSFRHREQ